LNALFASVQCTAHLDLHTPLDERQDFAANDFLALDVCCCILWMAAKCKQALLIDKADILE
jgi:hypothetical protein